MVINGTEAESIIPSKFFLSQNYPNPFCEKTKIKYCVPFRTKLKIEVFNSEGKLVKTLLDKEQKAGTYEIEFSARDKSAAVEDAEKLCEGIYFYQLKAEFPKKLGREESFIDKKMFVIKT